MQDTKRRQPNAAAKRLLTSYFYDQTCIVEGTPNGQWHHLDDDPSKDSFEDFVPLAQPLNTKLSVAARQAQKNRILMKAAIDTSRAQTWVPAILRPDALMGKAREWQMLWKPGRAYGACRLAYFVGSQYLGAAPDDLLTYAERSIYYLRHRPAHELLHDVLRRDVLPLTYRQDELSADAVAGILHEIACVWSEAGLIHEAYDLHAAIAGPLRRRSRPVGWHVNVQRRRAVLRALVDDNTRQAVTRIQRAADRAPGDVGIRVAADAYVAFHQFGAGDFRGARETLDEHTWLLRSIEEYARTGGHPSSLVLPPLNVAVATLYLQSYVIVRGVTDPQSRQAFMRKWDPVLTTAFEKSGSHLDHEVPFDWKAVLPGHESRLCRPLPPATKRLLARVTNRLVSVLRR